MLMHIYTNYARIMSNDFEENDKKMKVRWEPNELFGALVDQVTDRTEYTSAGNNA